jgi:DNA-binding CsgD family transcriptional regulator
VDERDELLGRTTELATLGALIERAVDGRPAVAFLEGEAGIGKTRLLDEVAGRVVGLGGLVLRGHAPPMSGEPIPFAAIARLLGDILDGLDGDERDGLVERSLGLGHLQPRWRVVRAATPPPTNPAALSEELVTVLEAVSGRQPIVAVLLDDLQWADPGTLDLVSSVARSFREGRIVLGLAARLEETSVEGPLHRIRAELLRNGAAAVSLAPLPTDDADAIVGRVSDGRLDGPARRRITALGRGNPLFLRELVATELASAGDGHLPESLIALTRARLAGLTDSQVAALQVLAIVGDGCTAEVVIRTLNQPDGATIADLRRLIDGRLVVRSHDDVLSIGHPLLRGILVDDILDSQRRRIAATAARILAAEPGLLGGPESERLIRQANLWHAAGDPIRAFPALVRAASAAEEGYAFATANDLYGTALEIAGAAASEPDHRLGFQPARTADDGLTDLIGRAADAAILAGDPELALRRLDRVEASLVASEIRDRLALIRSRALLALGDPAAALAVLRDAGDLGRAPESSISARLGLARALIAADDPGEAVPIATAALAAARAGRSRADEEAALLLLGTALLGSGSHDEGIARLLEATAIRRDAASQSMIRPRVSRVMDLTGGLLAAASATASHGSGPDAQALTSEAAVAAARWGAEGEAARLRLGDAIGAIEAGRWDEALGVLDDVVDQPVTAVAGLAHRARIAALRGAWDRAAADLARAEGGVLRVRPLDRLAFSVAMTELHSWRRQHKDASAAATEGLVMARDASPRHQLELVVVAIRTHVDAGLAARAVRSTAVVDEERAIALALTGSIPADAPDDEPRTRALALTARAEMSRLEADAPDAWPTARAAWESAGSAWWLAYASFRAGETLLAAAGRRDAARDALTQAWRLGQALEAAPLLTEIEALGVRGRIELSSAPAAPIAPGALEPTHRLPISDREVEVLVLIARGLTNKEIASELFISERTAAHHVGHIFDKLGVSSRVEAAGVAHQAGLVVPA